MRIFARHKPYARDVHKIATLDKNMIDKVMGAINESNKNEVKQIYLAFFDLILKFHRTIFNSFFLYRISPFFTLPSSWIDEYKRILKLFDEVLLEKY